MRILKSLSFIAALLAQSFLAGDVVVDASKRLGEIRPLHGVNGGVLEEGGTVDLSRAYAEIGTPLARLHDCRWPGPDVVDVHTVFPDPRADPGRPESYTFETTDRYLAAILATGARIVYRLGESIEHTEKKRWVHPPADPERWAAACAGIVRHYNEGWADGFRHGVRYWEIWNEPENRPSMWTGTEEDWFRLYTATSRRLKERFPEILVGGPSIGYPGKLRGDALEPSPFLDAFLERCRKDGAPLDFFSWHRYADDPRDLPRLARAVRKLLDERGFPRAESHLNEWNHLPGEDWSPLLPAGQGLARRQCFEAIGGAPGAAFTAAALVLLQDAPVDAANYYAGDTKPFGLFDELGAPRKPFHAFRAFRSLLDTPLRVETRSGDGELAACAGLSRDGDRASVLLARFRVGPRRATRVRLENLPWTGASRWEVLVIDREKDLEPALGGDAAGSDIDIEIALEAPWVALVRAVRR